jgi:hypothetical protein
LTTVHEPTGAVDRSTLSRFAEQLRAIHAGTGDPPTIDAPGARWRITGRAIDDHLRRARDRQRAIEWARVQRRLDRMATTGTVTRPRPDPTPPRMPHRGDPAAAERWERRRVELERCLEGILSRAPRTLPVPSPPPALPWDIDSRHFWSPTPILAFRAWQVGRRLHGAFRAWDTPTYEAGCVYRGAERMSPEVPHTDGSCGSPPCGIYATKDARAIARAWGGEDAFAFGLVELSGRVVEHDDGYRAQRATAIALVVSMGGRLVTAEGLEAVTRLFTDPARAIAEARDVILTTDRDDIPAAIAWYLEEARSRRESTWV